MMKDPLDLPGLAELAELSVEDQLFHCGPNPEPIDLHGYKLTAFNGPWILPWVGLLNG